MLLLILMVFSCIYRRNGKRMIEVYLCLSKKVSILCTDKNLYEKYLICTRKICMYIKNVGTYTVRVAHARWINKRMKTNERSLFMFEYQQRCFEYVQGKLNMYIKGLGLTP